MAANHMKAPRILIIENHSHGRRTLESRPRRSRTPDRKEGDPVVNQVTRQNRARQTPGRGVTVTRLVVVEVVVGVVTREVVFQGARTGRPLEGARGVRIVIVRVGIRKILKAQGDLNMLDYV